MREIDQYERQWLESPERAIIEKKMIDQFARDANTNYWNASGPSGSEYITLFFAVIVICLIIYCSI